MTGSDLTVWIIAGSLGVFYLAHRFGQKRRARASDGSSDGSWSSTNDGSWSYDGGDGCASDHGGGSCDGGGDGGGGDGGGGGD